MKNEKIKIENGLEKDLERKKQFIEERIFTAKNVKDFVDYFEETGEIKKIDNEILDNISESDRGVFNRLEKDFERINTTKVILGKINNEMHNYLISEVFNSSKNHKEVLDMELDFKTYLHNNDMLVIEVDTHSEDKRLLFQKHFEGTGIILDFNDMSDIEKESEFLKTISPFVCVVANDGDDEKLKKRIEHEYNHKKNKIIFPEYQESECRNPIGDEEGLFREKIKIKDEGLAYKDDYVEDLVSTDDSVGKNIGGIIFDLISSYSFSTNKIERLLDSLSESKDDKDKILKNIDKERGNRRKNIKEGINIGNIICRTYEEYPDLWEYILKTTDYREWKDISLSSEINQEMVESIKSYSESWDMYYKFKEDLSQVISETKI